MSKRALNELANYKEVNLFLRGIVPMLALRPMWLLMRDMSVWQESPNIR